MAPLTLLILGFFVIPSLGVIVHLILQHRESMAEIRCRTETAKALAAAPEEVQRRELAEQLLEAYGEAGQGLQNDKKGF